MPKNKLTDAQRKKGGKNSKRKSYDKSIQDFLNTEMSGGDTYAEALHKVFLKNGLKGDTKAGSWLLERAFGKARQNISLVGQMEHTVVESPLDKFQAIQAKIERLEKKQKKKGNK